MDSIIASNPMTCIIIALLVGLFIGYALSRKQQDKPVIEIPGIIDNIVTSDTMDGDPYYEAQQEPDPKGKRIGTVE